MFKKLVSNLPFNPGLIQQVAFYGKRLQKEESLRKLSFVFIAATFAINLLAIAVPAQNTLATSPNDIVYGASTKQGILSAYQNNRDAQGRTDIRAIYDYYGITESDIANAAQTTIRSRQQNFMSTGRWESPGDDDPQTIPGAVTTVYERLLTVWDIKNPENCYKVLTGTATGSGKISGKQFWISLGNCNTTSGGCGNIIFIPEPKTPKIETKKTRLSSDKLRVGESASYRIDYRNYGTAAAEWVAIDDVLASEFTYVSATLQPWTIEGQKLTWFIGKLEPSSEYHQITVTVQLNRITEATKQVCNAATLRTSNAGEATTENACIIIDNSCPGSGLPAPDGDLSKCEVTCPDGTKVPYTQLDRCPVPVVTCEKLQLIGSPDWNQKTVRLTTKKSTGAVINKVNFLADGKQVHSQNNPADVVEYTYSNLSEGSHTYSVTYDIKTGSLQSGASCEVKDDIKKPVPSISGLKKAKNVTKKIDDANGTTASAGDVIEYSVTTTNSGTGVANGYIIKPDTLGRVLEYADILDTGTATFDKTTQQLSWPAVDIRPGESITNVFSVKIKSPIPATPPSLSDPAGRQFNICNKYGNEVCVNIDKPVPAKIQTTAERLPNTGPGSSLVITFLIVCVIGFFYTRSHILSKEVELIKHDYAKGA